MATAAGDLVVNLGANTTKFDSKMGRSRGVLASFSGAATNLVKNLATIGGAAVFAGAIRSGEEFNQKMRNSLAIMGDVSDAMRKEMSDAAFDVASATRFSAAEAAESYFFLASAGLDAKQAIAALPQVAKFAQAGNFDMAKATDLATDAQSALGLTVKDAQKNLTNLTRVTDVLVKANTLANGSVEQFSEALTTKAGGALRIVNKDIEEGVAVLAAFADQGVKGALAGTGFSIVMRDLQTKAIKNAKAFKEARIAVFDQAGEMNNLADVIRDVETRLSGLSDMQKKSTLLQLGFTDKSVTFIQTLIGMSDKIRGYEKDLRKAGGTTEEVAGKQLTKLQEGTAKLGAAFTRLGLTLVNEFGPSIAEGMVLVSNMVRELAPLVVTTIKWAAGLLAAKAAIAIVNVAIRTYTAVTKGAAAGTAFLHALAGPAAWAKMAAGIAVAVGTIALMDAQISKASEDTKTLMANAADDQAFVSATAQAKKLSKQIANATGGATGAGPIVTGFNALQQASDSVQLSIRGMRNETKQLNDFFAEFSDVLGTGGPLMLATAENAEGARNKFDDLFDTLGEGSKQLNTLRSEFKRFRDAPGDVGAAAQASVAAVDATADAMGRLVRSFEEFERNKGSLSPEGFAAAQATLTNEIERFNAVTQDQSAIILASGAKLAEFAEVFNGIEGAVKFASKSLKDIQTPAQALEDIRKKIDAAFGLGLISASERITIVNKALDDFDAAMGGPKSQLADMRTELEKLQNGLSDSEFALQKFSDIQGVTPKQVEEFRKLQAELDGVTKASELADKGKALTEALLTPAERARKKIKEIQELFAAGDISAETRDRALREEAKGLKTDGQKDTKIAGALEKGSSEAFSAIAKAMGASGKASVDEKIAKSSAETAKETKDMKELMGQILLSLKSGDVQVINDLG